MSVRIWWLNVAAGVPVLIEGGVLYSLSHTHHSAAGLLVRCGLIAALIIIAAVFSKAARDAERREIIRSLR